MEDALDICRNLLGDNDIFAFEFCIPAVDAFFALKELVIKGVVDLGCCNFEVEVFLGLGFDCGAFIVLSLDFVGLAAPVCLAADFLVLPASFSLYVMGGKSFGGEPFCDFVGVGKPLLTAIVSPSDSMLGMTDVLRLEIGLQSSGDGRGFCGVWLGDGGRKLLLRCLFEGSTSTFACVSVHGGK